MPAQTTCCMCLAAVNAASAHALSCPHNAERDRVNYRGRMLPARRIERLPNGYYRADLAGSGLVAMYDVDPTNDPSVRQAF